MDRAIVWRISWLLRLLVLLVVLVTTQPVKAAVLQQVSSFIEAVLKGPQDATNTSVTADALSTLQLYANYASIAYCDARDWQCGERCDGPSRGSRFLADVFHDPTDTYAYIAVNEHRRELIVAFRGSVTRSSWWQNIDMFKDPMPMPDADNLEVHSGFLESFRSVQEPLQQAFLAALLEYPDFNVTHLGHSLGGALASVAAVQFHDLPSPKVRQRLVTFGSPPTGNRHFARRVERILDSSTLTDHDLPGAIRVVNYDDIIPTFLPDFFGYVHFDRELWISGPDDDQQHVNARWCSAQTKNGDPNCSMNITGRADYKRHGLYWGMLSGSPDQCRVPGPTKEMDRNTTVHVIDA